METPVVLLIFNRPDLTSRVWQVVRQVKPTTVVVVADGPRRDVPADQRLCREARAVIEEGIDWNCDLLREYADANLGCARRVASGLDAVFSRFREAIILEDDCVPDPTFFAFCVELLTRYREDDRIAAIAGDNFQMGRHVTDASYYFSRYPHCWGWATWRRAWRDYDFQMKAWSRAYSSRWLRERTQSRSEFLYWRDAFDSLARGSRNTWDYQWTFACWLHERMTILPHVNLVSNIGFRHDATHTAEIHPASMLETQPLAFPLRHPENVSVSDEADARTAALLFSMPSLGERIARRVKRALFS